MSRVRCLQCNQTENIRKAGIIRGKQRFYCKTCSYHFTEDKIEKVKNIGPNVTDKQVSLSDIANASGFSIATVSRALNEKSDISVKTRELIKVLAEKMNYQPNLLAKSFVKQSTKTLGVIIPSLDTTIFSTMLSGIQEMAASSGYRIIICTSNEMYEQESANIQALMNNMIDGLLICHSIQTNSFEHLSIHVNKRIPIVQFYRVALGLSISQVLASDERGALEVTEYLIKKGCRKIAVLLGPKEFSLSQSRLKGYKIALKKHEINFDERLLTYVDFGQESVYKSVDYWLTYFPDVDAIISISDKSAAQIITKLKSINIKVPNQIRVVGFGNEFVGEILDPKLTTFDTQTKMIGKEASRLILDQISSGKREIKKLVIPGKLIVRDSA